MQALKREGVDFIVAPYEADAQMAYLALSGDVDAVITEDSDLLPYGCPKVSLTLQLACLRISRRRDDVAVPLRLQYLPGAGVHHVGCLTSPGAVQDGPVRRVPGDLAQRPQHQQGAELCGLHAADVPGGALLIAKSVALQLRLSKLLQA